MRTRKAGSGRRQRHGEAHGRLPPIEGTEYVEVTVENGRIVLTPVEVVRAAAVRAKLAAMGITEEDVNDAVEWARSSAVRDEV